MRQTTMFEGMKAGAADNHANRGMSFEDALRWQHALYEKQGVARMDKQYIPTLPVKDGRWAKVVGRSTVDFTGEMAGGRFVAFDAKDCAGRRIDLARLQTHQLKYLEDTARLGGLAFVLVRFERQRAYRIPVAAWRWAIEAHRAAHEVYVEELDWTATGRNSINEKDLPQAWRVEGTDWGRTL